MAKKTIASNHTSSTPTKPAAAAAPTSQSPALKPGKSTTPSPITKTVLPKVPANPDKQNKPNNVGTKKK